jgi:hypothetical protein
VDVGDRGQVLKYKSPRTRRTEGSRRLRVARPSSFSSAASNRSEGDFEDGDAAS